MKLFLFCSVLLVYEDPKNGKENAEKRWKSGRFPSVAGMDARLYRISEMSERPVNNPIQNN
jgi:hypothetical protein